MKRFLYLGIIALIFISCKSSEKILYMQQSGTPVKGDSLKAVAIPDPIVKVGDVLVITINTNTPDAAVPFNLPLIPTSEGGRNYSVGGNISYGLSMQNYLVDMEGNIIYPVVGKIHVAGLTKTQLTNKLRAEIYPKYLKEDPIVLVRFGSFRISVLGEVARPGIFNIDNEKVSLLDAIAMAGDLTIFGQRQDVLLIREYNDHRETIRIDLRDKNLINSPYYFLQQGDVVYVSPNKTKTRSSFIGSAETLSISVVSTLISLTTLIVSLTR